MKMRSSSTIFPLWSLLKNCICIGILCHNRKLFHRDKLTEDCSWVPTSALISGVMDREWKSIQGRIFGGNSGSSGSSWALTFFRTAVPEFLGAGCFCFGGIVYCSRSQPSCLFYNFLRKNPPRNYLQPPLRFIWCQITGGATRLHVEYSATRPQSQGIICQVPIYPPGPNLPSKASWGVMDDFTIRF